MAKKDNTTNSKNAKPKSAPQSFDLSVGENVNNSVVVAGNNAIVNYYAAVTSNTEKHEPDYWNLKHPYPMPPNFTGRVAERAMLTQWLNDDSESRLFILRALGGFGKSALTWHWLTHDVDIKESPKVVFWSFYEGDASFEHFIEETLKYLKVEVPQGQRPQVDELLKALQRQKILLIMDGFERALRAYSSMNAAYQGDEEPKLEDNQLDCVNINAEIFLKSVCSLPSMKGKVLITTRLSPRAVKPHGECLQGCREVELTAMQKEDAVEFFHKQKIEGTRAEIETACAPYGYHPLSLRLLAGLIADDRESPGDIAVTNKLNITGDIIQNKHHVLEVAYNTLSSGQQKLLSNMACFRSPIDYAALKIIVGKPPRKRKKTKASSTEKLSDNLQILETRGLLQWDRKVNKYDLHPIVRRYAYERLTAADRITAHTRLRNYFAAIDTPEQAQALDEFAPIIELYYHMVRAGEFDLALNLVYKRLWTSIYFQFGAYQLCIELLLVLFKSGTNKLPLLKKDNDQGWTLSALSSAYVMSGQPHRAFPLFHNALQLAESINDKPNVPVVLGNIAETQPCIGMLAKAEQNFKRAIKLCQEIGNVFEEATDYCRLGRLLINCGEWTKSETNLLLAQATFDKMGTGGTNYSSVNMSYRALRSLLMAREQVTNNQSSANSIKSAIKSAEHALELSGEWTRTQYPMPRDYIRAHWLLGAAYCANDDLIQAEENLSKAISTCRQINNVETEADILLDLARLRYNQKKYEEAKPLADEALLITERCGYVLQGADVNLFLAQYALEQEKDKAKAKEYAESALELAYCDGPPYHYKVAYEEAERMLEKLK